MTHPNIPQCQYIKTDGVRCGSPALRGKPHCYFHYEVNRPTAHMGILPLENGDAIQLALTDIARAVLEDRIELKRASVLGYLLQTASLNLKRVQIGTFANWMVRELPEEDPNARNGAPQVSQPFAAQPASGQSSPARSKGKT